MRRALWVALLGGGIGCGDGNGVDVGRFAVEAVRTESCGDAGLLGSPAAAKMKVWLRRVGEQGMHWDDGSGRLMGFYHAAERSFVIEQRIQVDMREGDETLPACVIARRLTIRGTLDADPEIAGSFTAEQRFDYEPVEGSSCRDLLEGAQPIATAMPCSVAFELTGRR